MEHWNIWICKLSTQSMRMHASDHAQVQLHAPVGVCARGAGVYVRVPYDLEAASKNPIHACTTRGLLMHGGYLMHG